MEGCPSDCNSAWSQGRECVEKLVQLDQGNALQTCLGWQCGDGTHITPSWKIAACSQGVFGPARTTRPSRWGGHFCAHQYPVVHKLAAVGVKNLWCTGWRAGNLGKNCASSSFFLALNRHCIEASAEPKCPLGQSVCLGRRFWCPGVPVHTLCSMTESPILWCEGSFPRYLASWSAARNGRQ